MISSLTSLAWISQIIKAICPPCAGLCAWATAMYKYGKLVRKTEPVVRLALLLRQAVRDMETRMSEFSHNRNRASTEAALLALGVLGEWRRTSGFLFLVLSSICHTHCSTDSDEEDDDDDDDDDAAKFDSDDDGTLSRQTKASPSHTTAAQSKAPAHRLVCCFCFCFFPSVNSLLKHLLSLFSFFSLLSFICQESAINTAEEERREALTEMHEAEREYANMSTLIESSLLSLSNTNSLNDLNALRAVQNVPPQV